MTQARLPGVGRGRTKTGRHRRGFDAFARECRRSVDGVAKPVLDDELTTLRGLVDELDRLESDAEHSAHTFALVSRTYWDLRREVAARLPSSTSNDPLADALAAALRDSSTT